MFSFCHVTAISLYKIYSLCELQLLDCLGGGNEKFRLGCQKFLISSFELNLWMYLRTMPGTLFSCVASWKH